MTSTTSTTSVASMTSTASFHQKTFNLKKIFLLVCYLLSLEMELKSQEQEVLTNWTIDGAKHQKNKDWLDRKNIVFLRTSYTKRKSNFHSHQSQFTLHSLLWDTLYATCIDPSSFFSDTLKCKHRVILVRYSPNNSP